MNYDFPPEVDQLIRQQMATGQYDSEDQLLVDALNSLQSEREELSAIQASIESLDRGEPGYPLQEAFDILRQQHNIPSDA